jgi:serine/threonine protein kinase
MISTSGHVKVLDFGLAKVAEPIEASNRSNLSTAMQTREGIAMGTMPYMSPEQIEGEEVDARTDIFSLGVVLHEMAAGKRPFHGPTAPALFFCDTSGSSTDIIEHST